MAHPLTMPLPSAPAELPAPRPKAKSPYILSPAVDAICIIFSPLLALALGFLASHIPPSVDAVTLFSKKASLVGLGTLSMIHAHLVIVFFRSHGNRAVFRQFPLRFTVVPLVVFAGMMLQAWFFYFAWMVVILWDVYHSSMQVFGLSRIYDSKRGVDPAHGRTMDLLLSHVLYIGPILAGVNLMAHLDAFKQLNHVGSTMFDFIPAYATGRQWMLTEAVVVLALLFVAYYVFWQIREARAGMPVSAPKVALLASTAICSVCAWGFNSFGQAFLIMNAFHAIQYFAIVWWAERDTVKRTFRVDRLANGNVVALGLLVVLALNYGFWVAAAGPVLAGDNDWIFRLLISVSNTVAMMHFWYDGFVWSVRAKAVPT